MSKNTKYAAAASAVLAAILICMAIAPARYAAACLEGLRLWLNFIVPTLFPFFVLTALLTKLGFAAKASRKLSPFMQKAFRLPGAASYAFMMSALSGYPVGSRVTADLAQGGFIGREETTFAGALCSTSGPMFVIGSVGAAMFRHAGYGLILFASHLIGVVGVSLIAARLRKKAPAARKPLPPLARADNMLYESVYGAVLSILCVGGFVALFFVLTEMLSAFKLLAPLGWLFSKIFSLFGAESAGMGFAVGLLEVTHGCAAVAQAGKAALPPAAFLITFGGACILAQQLGYLKRAGAKAGTFLLCKLAQGTAAFFVCLGLCAVLPI